jgi:hypothetical protein
MQERSEVTEEVVIVVKAVPQPSQRYGETVCCAGLTRQGEWRRLYPIRFRHLKDKAFSRWQWVQCRTARSNRNDFPDRTTAPITSRQRTRGRPRKSTEGAAQVAPAKPDGNGANLGFKAQLFLDADKLQTKP